MDEIISYAKTVYGNSEIEAVVKCLNESTQMGNYARAFENKIAKLFNKIIVCSLILVHQLFT